MKLDDYTLSFTNNRYKFSTFLKAYMKMSVYRVMLILSTVIYFKEKAYIKINGNTTIFLIDSFLGENFHSRFTVLTGK